MARLAEVLFHVDGVVAEGGGRFRTGGRPGLDQVGLGLRDLHAASAAAGRCLDQHRDSRFRGRRLQRVFFGLHFAVRAGNDGNAECQRGCLGGDLVAHDADMIGRRPDEGDAVGFEDVGELGVFRQEAVARMHGIGAGDLAGGDDLMDVQIAFARGRRADADALVGKAHMHRVGVGGGVNRDARRCRVPCRRAAREGRFRRDWR